MYEATKKTSLPNAGLAAIGLIVCMSVGCSSQNLIIDKKGVPEDKYQRDLTECRAYQAEVSSGKEVAKQAGIGAIVGGVIGAVVGNSNTAADIAGVGAISGTLKGAQNSARRKNQVIANCMKGRGYSVLG